MLLENLLLPLSRPAGEVMHSLPDGFAAGAAVAFEEVFNAGDLPELAAAVGGLVPTEESAEESAGESADELAEGATVSAGADTQPDASSADESFHQAPLPPVSGRTAAPQTETPNGPPPLTPNPMVASQLAAGLSTIEQLGSEQLSTDRREVENLSPRPDIKALPATGAPALRAQAPKAASPDGFPVVAAFDKGKAAHATPVSAAGVQGLPPREANPATWAAVQTAQLTFATHLMAVPRSPYAPDDGARAGEMPPLRRQPEATTPLLRRFVNAAQANPPEGKLAVDVHPPKTHHQTQPLGQAQTGAPLPSQTPAPTQPHSHNLILTQSQPADPPQFGPLTGPVEAHPLPDAGLAADLSHRAGLTELSSTTGAVLQAKPASPYVAALAATREALVALSETSRNQIEIQLNPKELGKLRFSMSPSEGQIMVQISAERPEILDELRRNISVLSDELRAFGFGDAQFTFEGEPHPPPEEPNGPEGQAAALSSEGTQTPATTHWRIPAARLDMRL